MPHDWTVSLEVVAPPLDDSGPDEVRTAEIAASASSRASAGARAVAVAKSYGWKVLSILDVKPREKPSTLSRSANGKLLSFPTPSGKPN